MAIVKMNKFTLLTFEDNSKNLLKELQKIGVVHFKDLQKEASEEELAVLDRVSSSEEITSIESELSKVKFVLSKIEPYVEKLSGIKALTEKTPEFDYEEFESFSESYNYDSVYTAVKEQDDKLKALNSEKNRLNSENDSLRQWLSLDISTAETDKLKSVRCFCGTVPTLSASSFIESVQNVFPNIYIELLDSIKEETTVFIISMADEDVSTELKLNGFTRVNLNLEKSPEEIINENTKRIDEITLEEAACKQLIAEQAGEYQSIQMAMDYFNTVSERSKAQENFLSTKRVYLVEGWVPIEEFNLFTSTITKVCGSNYYLEHEEVEKENEEVPIKLKNNKFFSAFENITQMYAYPKYGEMDPTPVMAPFYFAFFGIMMGDAGYGLVMFIATLLMLKYANMNQGMRSFIRFFNYLSIAVMIFGVVFGSMFGVTVPLFCFITGPDGNPRPLLDYNTDIVLMLVLSVGIGVFHIIFGLGVKGYMLIRDGKYLDAVFDSLFWITTVISLVGLVVSVAVKPEILSVFGWIFGLSVLGLAATQGRQSPSVGGKVANGLYSVYNITSYVGDFVSYTRLVALMLSGAYIAFSFNLMAGMVFGDPAGTNFLVVIIKFIFAALIAVIGGALNFGLAALGAYVHTCRLQYVEYFGKFYEGGGKPFKPFELKNTFINIKK